MACCALRSGHAALAAFGCAACAGCATPMFARHPAPGGPSPPLVYGSAPRAPGGGGGSAPQPQKFAVSVQPGAVAGVAAAML
jgi:hypothetical protein